MTPGGVGRNVAENLARLGTCTFLVAAVGRDAAGESLLNQTGAAGVRLEYVHRTDLPTGTYVALLDCDGELVSAVADMAATSELGPAEVNRARDVIATAGLVVLDGNLSPGTRSRHRRGSFQRCSHDPRAGERPQGHAARRAHRRGPAVVRSHAESR